MNMSLGGAKSAALNAAIDQMTAQGVIAVVAAGNENVSYTSATKNLPQPNTLSSKMQPTPPPAHPRPPSQLVRSTTATPKPPSPTLDKTSTSSPPEYKFNP